MSLKSGHTDISKHNWSGHIRFGAGKFHEPHSIAELQKIARDANQVRVIGSRHSFNDIADTSGDLVWLGKIKGEVVIDETTKTGKVPAGITYEELCPVLERAGYALPNLASLKHITVVGACMTGTHGSGNDIGNLATQVCGLEMIDAEGELVKLTREDNETQFSGAVIAMGALGLVTTFTLDLQSSFMLQQDAYQELPFTQLHNHFDEITSSAYSVSLFPTWQEDFVDTLWLKRKVEGEEALEVPESFYGAVHRPPEIASQTSDDRTLTPFGNPNPWHIQLPHYRLHEPLGLGNELQSEYFVDHEYVVDAIKAIQALKPDMKSILGLSEIRTIAADDLWLSPAFGNDTVGIHFNWRKKWEGIREFLPKLEEVLKPFKARPHMGKLFAMQPDELATVYPRWNDFRELVNKYDPEGKFSNRFIRKYVFGKDA